MSTPDVDILEWAMAPVPGGVNLPFAPEVLSALNRAGWFLVRGEDVDDHHQVMSPELPDGHDHVPIRIDRPTRVRLRHYLMSNPAARGMGYTAFIERALDAAEDGADAPTPSSPATPPNSVDLLVEFYAWLCKDGTVNIDSDSVDRIGRMFAEEFFEQGGHR